MFDGVLSGLQFAEGSCDEVLHLLTSAQDGDGLLVLVRVDLDLINQFLVDQFVLVDQTQQFVQFCVQQFVVVQAQEVLLAQFLLLSDDQVELIFLASDAGLHSSYFSSQLFALANLVVEIRCVGACLGFVFFRLS